MSIEQIFVKDKMVKNTSLLLLPNCYFRFTYFLLAGEIHVITEVSQLNMKNLKSRAHHGDKDWLITSTIIAWLLWGVLK